jgi:hypothetical protein
MADQNLRLGKLALEDLDLILVLVNHDDPDQLERGRIGALQMGDRALHVPVRIRLNQ